MSGSGASSSSIGPKFPLFSGKLQGVKSSRDCFVSLVGEPKVKDAGRLEGGKSSFRKGGERVEPGEPKLDSDSTILWYVLWGGGGGGGVERWRDACILVLVVCCFYWPFGKPKIFSSHLNLKSLSSEYN